MPFAEGAPLADGMGGAFLGAEATGTLPSGLGERFVIVVVLETIGAGRNMGATGVRQPQYLSSLPRKMFRSACWDS